MALEDSNTPLTPLTAVAQQSTAASNRTPVSEKEAEWYYFGLPSKPRLVARSSTTPWTEPTGPEAYPERKELGPAGSHKLSKVWNELAPGVIDLLKSHNVQWTSIDIVRIGTGEGYGYPPDPVILWLGVYPGSLSPVDGLVVALACKDFLQQNDITDVDVEIRESVVHRGGEWSKLEVNSPKH